MNEEHLFGQIAARLQGVAPSHVEECLALQQKYLADGVREKIGELLVKKGRLTAEQVQAVLRRQQVLTGRRPVIGGFELLQKIGEGGMGFVYKARDIALRRIVALKVLAPRLARDRDFIERFQREARAAATLDHVNIVRALDVGESDGYYYFSMEYVDGQSLRRAIETRGRIPETEAILYAIQVARALDHAAEHQLVHRDIKPDNILIDGTGVAKLTDLGLAKSTRPEDQRLTITGMAVGTPGYISPEQARGERHVDIRSDLYSLGVVLFHLVTGRQPYEGETAAVVMTKHITEPVPWAPAEAPDVSRGLGQTLQKMMAKRREDRYPSAKALIEDLERVAEGKPPWHAASVVPPGEAELEAAPGRASDRAEAVAAGLRRAGRTVGAAAGRWGAVAWKRTVEGLRATAGLFNEPARKLRRTWRLRGHRRALLRLGREEAELLRKLGEEANQLRPAELPAAELYGAIDDLHLKMVEIEEAMTEIQKKTPPPWALKARRLRRGAAPPAKPAGEEGKGVSGS